MKLFLTLCMNIALGNVDDGFVQSQDDLQKKLNFTPIVYDDVNYEEFYLEHLPHLMHDQSISNAEVTSLNTQWLNGVGKNQATFLNAMINMWQTVPINPMTLKSVIDPTPYCWTILVYNSDDTSNYEALRSLLFAMSKHLFERSGVASLDLAYPANAMMMKKIFPNPMDDAPAILIRGPNAMLAMTKSFFPKKDEDGEKFYELNELNGFGELLTRDALESDVQECLARIMAIYKSTTDNIKVMSIFMDHYNERGKQYLQNYLRKYQKELVITTMDQLEDQGLLELRDLPNLKSMSDIQIQKYSVMYKTELNLAIGSIYGMEERIFRKELEKNMKDDFDGKGMVKDKRPNFHPKVRRTVTPLKQISPEPFLHEWNDYVATRQEKKHEL